MDGREIIRRRRLFPGAGLSLVREWMEAAGLTTRMDDAGNLCGVYGDGPRLTIGAHLDSGILGILIGMAVAEHGPPCAVEVVALTANRPIDLEFCSEQGPLLECLGLPFGVVETIAGMSRWDVRFEGKAGHAGATPMNMRHDALACSAEWIGLVEHVAQNTAGLVATVGSIEVTPAEEDTIPGTVKAILDVRHAMDEVRERALERDAGWRGTYRSAAYGSRNRRGPGESAGARFAIRNAGERGGRGRFSGSSHGEHDPGAKGAVFDAAAARTRRTSRGRRGRSPGGGSGVSARVVLRDYSDDGATVSGAPTRCRPPAAPASR